MDTRLNHDQRRQWIIQVVRGIIGLEGIEAATIRRVAGEVGYSTMSVTHYFSGKDDLLISTFQSFAELARRSFEIRYRADPQDIIGHLAAISAASDEALVMKRCFYALRSKALTSSRFQEELERYYDNATQRIAMYLNTISPQLDRPDRAAHRLLGIVESVSSQSIIRPNIWSPSDIRGEFGSALRTLLGPQYSPAD